MSEKQTMSKAEEAQAESSRARDDMESTPPPIYTEPVAESSNFASHDVAPPASLADAITSDIRSLETGDPNESIQVPMILSSENKSFKDFLKGRSGKVTQTVIVRKMTRDHYRKHYAKDSEGNYIGTEKPAVDAGLVFVPSKSTPEDILKQVQNVAFGKQHHISDYGGALGVPGVGAGGGGA